MLRTVFTFDKRTVAASSYCLIIISFKFVDDPNLNLTSIICIIGGLQLWSRFTGKIYKKRILEILESN